MRCIMFIMKALVFISIQVKAFEDKKPTTIFPEDYDKHEPPWKPGKPAHVHLQLCIMDVDSIDDGAMQFSIQSYLLEYWMDDRLNLSLYLNGALNPVFPSYLQKFLWLPDLIFDNTRKGAIFHLAQPNIVVKVLKNGSFLRDTRYNLEVGCQMDFHLYPMDTQHCFLKIATMSSSNDKVQLHWIEELQDTHEKSIMFMNDIQPLMYTLSEPRSYKTVEVWPTGNYSYLYANFTFVRRLSGSLFNVYVPSTLVVFLSWISFWLDEESVPARVTLGVTSLLTLATQVERAHNGLPEISYLTAMDVWLFVCLIMVFSSLIEFAFAYQLFILNKKEKISLLSESGRSVHLKNDLCIFKTRKRSFCRKSHDRWSCGTVKSLATDMCQLCVSGGKKLDRRCRVLFPVIFILFTFIYWTYYSF